MGFSKVIDIRPLSHTILKIFENIRRSHFGHLRDAFLDVAMNDLLSYSLSLSLSLRVGNSAESANHHRSLDNKKKFQQSLPVIQSARGGGGGLKSRNLSPSS